MSKISAINGMHKHYESPMQQALNAIPKFTTTRSNSPAPISLLHGKFPKVVSETRAVFPELPAPKGSRLYTLA